MPLEIPGRRRPQRPIVALVVGIGVAALLFGRTFAGYVIEYQWWREMGQVETWLSMVAYQLAPIAAATLPAFIAFLVAHSRAVRFAGVSLSGRRLYAWLARLGALALALLISSAAINTWDVVRFFGGRQLPPQASGWRDAVFGEPLKFYLFDLPFYRVLLGYFLAVTIVAMLVYWLTARVWQIRERFSEFQQMQQIDLRVLGLEGALSSPFLRAFGGALLAALGVRFYLGRYQMLYNDHGFMVGIDYVDLNWTLWLQWVVIAACIVSIALVALGRWRWTLIVAAALIAKWAIPAVVVLAYVRPNEITIERPYIQTHIEATRAAFGLDHHVKELEYKVRPEASFDPARNQAVLSNVRLWDWPAFHATVMQLQALRTYYNFSDTDVDRYIIDGQLRQVLISPRELDIQALPDAASGRWPVSHLMYTHGYGLVLAEANRIGADGLPVLFIQDIPPVVKTPSLKLTRPELYYGEIAHEPVFVRTKQDEFNYPSGDKNMMSHYEGKGGFPISSAPLRLAAALVEGDPNILLTSDLRGESRMMIRRRVRDRLAELAGFLSWDPDPYLVLTSAGRLVWTLDGYTTSNAHPYSRSIGDENLGVFNYVRNAVKATVDAYDGETHLYVFDQTDPIIGAYQRLFPRLFLPASAMPADLRAHARYPEGLFRQQAEIYRAFHMQDPQSFYNREDLWDVAEVVRSQAGQKEVMTPTYVVASLPGEDHAEFLLLVPFTPRNKPNLAGLMMARCDGDHLGEIVVLQVSKQQLVTGPVQVEATINQDQTISKDLTLWNQQGSKVLRAQMLVLPVADTLLYVEPIYLQASQAPMPQLKKIAMMMGTHLIYTDTYEQALEQLYAIMRGMPVAGQAAPAAGAATATPAAPPPPAGGADPRIQAIRQRLQRYRELAAQGHWAEAGKELEAIESEVSRR